MYEIDFAGIATVGEFYERVGAAIALPDYCGNNLDALHDVLSEMKGRIIIGGLESVDDDMTGYMDRFRAMCADLQAENMLLEIVFTE